MKLYENVVIGNFLYGLGISIGRQLKSGYLPGAVSLLQQTPEDKALGDVLLDFPGTLRLIEFKAQGNTSKKELSRYRKLLPTIQESQEMLSISRRVHWYVETAPSPLRGVEAFFSPYLDVFEKEKPAKQPFALERFIESVADDVIASKSDERDVLEKNYLKLVRWCQGAGETGAGALIVVVGSGGGIEFVALEDLMALNMSYKEWMEYRQDQELKMERALEMGIERKELQMELGLSYER
ncbi:5-bromo-4-chloroindolyl phosphate hydrolysis family protein [Dickeya chrysanthemi]|uniref:5-bromo-4-chloroindolyl phosphate hydrolysis family protein n=1 Tax=Dickeya chrysanthemi TaxID=556 RepID=UPI001CF151EA|nr:5-bromo-4-chloroindolyl phosphate hydrolysis family protein [Dickeya chrysanthemi]MCA7007727.1 5-bromo-4-chloroindolyl phosphate hydrolysis family protein [Dickeya chrysanthemi]